MTRTLSHTGHGAATIAIVVASLVTGCTKSPPQLAPTKPTEVVVSRPVVRKVTDYEDFTGRTEATNTIDIRAQVTGYLDAVNFKDGADVREGDLLFQIDPQMYAAEYDQAKATLSQAKAHLDRVTRDYNRLIGLRGTKAVSTEEVDRVIGDREEADAAVKVAEASLKRAETNLGYTQIRAKFSGRVSRRAIYPGNVVKANDTLLTNLVALDPIYTTFDVDERTLLRIGRMKDGKVTSAGPPGAEDVTVQIALADEDSFARPAKVDFVDNKVDPNTGTIKVRATLPNPNLLLSPGLFVRVRLPIGKAHRAILVPEEALGSDQGQKFVFVVNDADEVVYRRVRTGLQVDRMRVVEEGVSPSDRVIVSGLQRVRAGVKVNPRPTDGGSRDRGSSVAEGPVASSPSAAARGPLTLPTPAPAAGAKH